MKYIMITINYKTLKVILTHYINPTHSLTHPYQLILILSTIFFVLSMISQGCARQQCQCEEVRQPSLGNTRTLTMVNILF